jgi:hypothetical protein
MKGVIAGLLFCFFLIVFGKKKAFENSKQQVQSIRVKTKADIVIDDKETYRTIAEHVAKTSRKSKSNQIYSVDEIRRAIHTIAAAQKALKTMDGATHRIKSSLKSRYVICFIPRI